MLLWCRSMLYLTGRWVIALLRFGRWWCEMRLLYSDQYTANAWDVALGTLRWWWSWVQVSLARGVLRDLLLTRKVLLLIRGHLEGFGL